MAKSTDDSKSTTPPTPPAARPGKKADAAPVRLVSRYAELGIRDIVRFHGGRATVTREEFDRLRALPDSGHGSSWWEDTAPEAPPAPPATTGAAVATA